MWIIAFVGLLLGAGGPANVTPVQDDLAVSAIRGEALARRRCSACHAVGPSDASSNPDAPPLRDLGDRYPVENLEEAFAEGIIVAHDGPMPPFVFEADEVRDLIAYLRKLQDERRGEAGAR